MPEVGEEEDEAEPALEMAEVEDEAEPALEVAEAEAEVEAGAVLAVTESALKICEEDERVVVAPADSVVEDVEVEVETAKTIPLLVVVASTTSLLVVDDTWL